MKHLTVDEIVDFVTLEKIDNKSLENAAKVNTHIRQCSGCLRKVRAFQMVYDEFEKMYNEKTDWKSIAEKVFNNANKNSGDKDDDFSWF